MVSKHNDLQGITIKVSAVPTPGHFNGDVAGKDPSHYWNNFYGVEVC
jgi:hypothetical protein